MVRQNSTGCVLVATHQSCAIPSQQPYRSILVGATHNRAIVGEQRFDYYDDEGEQISQRNPVWCELTALYWAWKNHRAPYIGLCHYRRYFVAASPKTGLNFRGIHLLDGQQIESLLARHRIILPRLSIRYTRSIYSHYAAEHHARDLEQMRSLIAIHTPEDLPEFERVMGGHVIYWYNMFVCDWETFDAYMNWLMPLLFALERRIDSRDYTPFQRRVIGFIAERLLLVWLRRHVRREEIAEIPQVNINTEGRREADARSRSVERRKRPLYRWLDHRWCLLWE